MSVVEFWDNIYRDATAPVTFGGGNPSADVVETAKLLPSGARAIDVGCGDGRNALFLAEQGCNVTAIDISPVAIAKLKQFATERGLVIQASVQDIRYSVFECEYDLVVCLGCLHLIEREYWQPLLRRLQEHTCVGGYNVVGMFTNALPAPDDQRDYFIGLSGEGELFDQYADWDVIAQRSYEFHDEHPGTIRHHHAGNSIVARKVFNDHDGQS